MALPNEIHPFAIAGGGNQYQIANSLRFRASNSASLTRTPGSAGNRQIFTFSTWLKRGTLSLNQGIFAASSGADQNNEFLLFFGSGNGDTISVQQTVGGTSAGQISTISNAVFRDPSAWYHIVLAIDTTQATSTNRLFLYVNGVSQTFSSYSVGSSINTWVNNTNGHSISKRADASLYFDGYQTEIYLIDGQQLDPTYFGQTDSVTGIWQPKKYTGTYGTNGFYLPFNSPITSSFSATFNGSSQYLTTAVNAGLGLGTSDFTIEYWMNVNSATNGTTVVAAGAGVVSYDGLFGYITTGALVTYLSSTGGSWDIASNRTAIASITTGRWYHIAYTRSGSTWRVFVDGTQVDTFTSSASLYQSGNQFTLGRGQSTGYFNGSLSNVRVIKGTALYTSNFSPPTSPLTAVTNTQLLTIQDSTIIDNSTNAISITNTGTVTTTGSIIPWTNFIAGRDYSTNQFGWLSTNINATTSGTTYDVMIDSPTNYNDGSTYYNRGNYATVSVIDIDRSNITTTEGNLKNVKATASDSPRIVSSIGATRGKFYAEINWTSITDSAPNADYVASGVTTKQNWSATDNGYNSVTYWASNSIGGVNGYRNIITNGSASGLTAYGTGYWSGGLVGIALNLDDSQVTFYLNGVSQSALSLPSTSEPWFFFCTSDGTNNGYTNYFNFGQRPFSYTPPAGYLALNTYNLANPSLPLV